MTAAMIYATITTDREDFEPRERSFPDSASFGQFLDHITSYLDMTVLDIDFPEICGCGDLCYCQQCMAQEEAQHFLEVAA